MDIRLATDVDQVKWDQYVLKHADGLAYHQYAWRQAIAEAYGLSARYFVAEQGGEVCGVLPLIDFKRPLLGHCYMSLPYCDQAGCLADDYVVEKALLGKAQALAVKEGAEAIELRQKSQRTGSDCAASGVHKVRMVLELPRSSDLLLQGLKSKLRSQVLKPERDGLVAVLGGEELIPDFYRVFAENMRDLGSPVHSRQWISSIVKYYTRNVRVGLVYTPAGEPAAGGVILLHGQAVSIPWASSLRKFNRMNSNMLLYWTFLAFAADQGFRKFDFGRSTPGEGTYRFKEQWGARPVALDWKKINHNGEVSGAISSRSGMRMWLMSIWMRMPRGFCNACGPLLRRYVSL